MCNVFSSHALSALSADLRSALLVVLWWRDLSLSQGALYAQHRLHPAAFRASAQLSNLRQASHRQEGRRRKLREWPFKIKQLKKKKTERTNCILPETAPDFLFLICCEPRDLSGFLLVVDRISSVKTSCGFTVFSINTSILLHWQWFIWSLQFFFVVIVDLVYDNSATWTCRCVPPVPGVELLHRPASTPTGACVYCE